MYICKHAYTYTCTQHRQSILIHYTTLKCSTIHAGSQLEKHTYMQTSKYYVHMIRYSVTCYMIMYVHVCAYIHCQHEYIYT